MPSDHGFIPSSADDLLRRRVKAELRKRMRGVRSAFPLSVCADKSRLIADRLQTLEPIVGARGVALFWPIEKWHEVDLRPLHHVFRGRGVRVAYPSIGASSDRLAFRFAEPEALQPHELGFLQPPDAAPEAGPLDLDVVVVPALALDGRGYRIGYGRGYYDRALPRFMPPAVAVGVAFDFQLLAELPETEGDVRVTWIVTEARVLSVK